MFDKEPKPPSGIDLFVIGRKENVVKRGLINWLINVLVVLLRKVFKVDEGKVWDLIDEISRKFKIDDINDVVINNPVLLKRRIKREVDKAIEEYHDKMDEIEPPLAPKFTEVKEGETPLGGELRLSLDLNGQTQRDQETD
jgi:hypothetical protein